MSYNRYGGGSARNQGGIPSPWANQANQPTDNGLNMNLLGSMMSSGSGNMANLATSLVAQALQNKPGGMMIGGNHFPSTGSAFNNSAPRGGGFMDRRGRDDYGRGRDNRDNSSRRPPFRRSRSRSRDRGRGSDRGSARRNDSSSRTNRPPSEKRARAGSPKDRADFEVYIGNYPVRFRENDVRNLFTEHGVTVTTIRLKHDGHKVFAFAETSSEEEIQKAIKAMDSKEIHGRRLRVRSSKDKDRKDREAAERKRPAPKRELTEDDVTRHLVFAFNGFLDRQANKESVDEEKKKKIEEAKNLLKEAFEIPDDDSLKISRNLELIFLHNNRREIPVPQAAEEPKDEKEETEEKNEDTEKTENDVENEKADGETDAKENGEEAKDAPENLVEEEIKIEEANEEAEENEDATEEAEEEETEEQEEAEEEDAEVEDETEDKPSTPSTRGGRGRGGATARRSRGRRGGAP